MRAALRTESAVQANLGAKNHATVLSDANREATINASPARPSGRRGNVMRSGRDLGRGARMDPRNRREGRAAQGGWRRGGHRRGSPHFQRRSLPRA